MIISKLNNIAIVLGIIGLFVLSPFLHVHAQVPTEGEMTAGEAMDLLMEYYGDDEQVSPELFDESVDDTFINPSTLPPDEFFRAKVVEIIDERREELYEGYVEEIQEVRIEIVSGNEKGQEMVLVYGGIASIDEYQRLEQGDVVLVTKTHKIDGGTSYYITDHYRLTPLIVILSIFAALAIFFARWKGVGSLLGLGFSIIVLAKFVVPQIINGKDPLMVTLIGVCVIAGVSLFLAHGFNKRTSVALLSTLITLGIAFVVSQIFVEFAYLFGRGTEEAFYLQIGEFGSVNLRGLLLAGIVIGTLGVLDDITTAQTAVVGELRQANQKLSVKELYARALVVGREHIASLVNTLVLAYAGASLPLFILFSVNVHVPVWVKLNSELIAEELIRTVVGSTALILAVPIATLLAAYFLRNEKIKEGGSSGHTHIH